MQPRRHLRVAENQAMRVLQWLLDKRTGTLLNGHYVKLCDTAMTAYGSRVSFALQGVLDHRMLISRRDCPETEHMFRSVHHTLALDLVRQVPRNPFWAGFHLVIANVFDHTAGTRIFSEGTGALWRKRECSRCVMNTLTTLRLTREPKVVSV
jgi:hypothetical protein